MSFVQEGGEGPHGQSTEGGGPAGTQRTVANVPIELETHGRVVARTPDLAVARVASLLRLADGHVQSARVTLVLAPAHAYPKPAAARVILVIDDRVMLAQAEDKTLHGAIGHMCARLRTRLERRSARSA